MTSLEDPTKMIADPAGFFMVPEGEEYIGDVMNVLFTNGWIADEDKGIHILCIKRHTYACGYIDC